jgi:hypothetical protein
MLLVKNAHRWGHHANRMPVPLEAQSGVTAIAAGYAFFNLAVKNGAIVVW